MTDMAERKLTPKQAMFVREYLVDLNATQAAIRAGYAVPAADVQGARLLGDARIRAKIDAAVADRANRTEITADRVLLELGRLAMSNMLDYVQVQKDGTAYVDLSSLTRDQAAAIQEMTVDEYSDGKGDEARAVKRVKVKLADKHAPLQTIARHLGMLKDKIEHSGVLTLEQLVAASAAKKPTEP